MKRLAALALICPLATACGSTGRLSPTAYRGQLATIAKQADHAQTEAEQALRAKTVAQIHSRLNAFAASDNRLADEITALKPPADAEQANTALAKAEHDMAHTIRSLLPRLAQATSAKAAIGLIQNDRQATQAGDELDTALSRLKKLGYTRGT